MEFVAGTRPLPELRSAVFQAVAGWLAAESRRLAREAAGQRHTITTLHRQVRCLEGSLRVSERLRAK